MISVAVNIVTWNGKEFLGPLLQSLAAQTMKPKRILVVDNGSVDGTLELLKEWPHIHVLRNNRNLGFTHAHNQALALSDADAVLVVNQDMIVEPRCIERLAAALERDARIGSVSPKLLRFSFSNDDAREPIRSTIIDSAGLSIKRSRQAINRFEGSPDADESGMNAEIFGVCGGLALYRKQALDEVAYGKEYFDDDFFAYKEDVDLAWRLRWAGWSSWYIADAVAYHYRTLSHHGDSFMNVVENRSRRSPLLRTLSYRNHLLTMIKNEIPGTFLPDLPYILFYELRRLGYLLLREWGTLTAIPKTIRLLPRILQKRRHLSRIRKTDPSAIRSHFTP